MNRPTWRRLSPVGLALIVLVAACGGGDDVDEVADGDPPSEADGTAAGAATACGLLTLDEVSALFGEEAVVTGGGDGASDSACLWESESAGDDPTAIRHQLSLSVFEDDRDLEPSAWGEGAEPVDNLGDEAFVVSSEALGTTAAYRQDRRSVILTYLVSDADADPAEDRDELVELLRSTEARF